MASAAALLELGDRYWALGLPAAAKSVLARALAATEDAGPALRLADLALAQGDAQSARKYATEAAKRAPGPTTKILLGRAPHFVAGVYSALAGFVEAGESLEECVHREVDEEVGISVHNLHYFCSQSWPFPHSLMLAFVADYVGGEIRPNPAELSDARWFSVDELPKLPGKISISRALIDSVINDIRSRQPA